MSKDNKTKALEGKSAWHTNAKVDKNAFNPKKETASEHLRRTFEDRYGKKAQAKFGKRYEREAPAGTGYDAQ